MYLGLDTSVLRNIKDEDIDIKRKTIVVTNCILPLPNGLVKILCNYLGYKKNYKIKCKYLIYVKYNGKYDKIDKSCFHDVVSRQADKIEQLGERSKLIKSSFIKASLIKKLFQNGFSIEEIKYITGLSLSSIGKYITDDDITNKVKKNLNKLIISHPYKQFFE